MNTPNTTTEFSPVRKVDLAADRAHRVVDRVKEKAAPMLHRRNRGPENPPADTHTSRRACRRRQSALSPQRPSRIPV